MPLLLCFDSPMSEWIKGREGNPCFGGGVGVFERTVNLGVVGVVYIGDGEGTPLFAAFGVGVNEGGMFKRKNDLQVLKHCG